MPLNLRGFTLVELLVVMVILGILGVIALTVYNGVTAKAQEAKKKADVEAMAKAYEANMSATGGYQALNDSQFATGTVPMPPDGGSYYNDLVANGGFRVCTAINGGTDPCNANSSTCFCKESTQVAYVAASTPTPTPTSTPTPTPTPTPPSGGLVHPASCDPSETLDDGLVGYWRLDESSGTTAVDETGNTDGTVFNATFGSGYPNSTTMSFGNGINIANGNAPFNYIDLGNTATLNITGPMTISAWINPALNTGTTLIVSRSANSVTTTQYELLKSNANLLFRISNGTVFSSAQISSAFSTGNTWYHVAGVFDGSNLVAYRNGASGTSVAFTGSQTVYNNNVNIGRRSNASSANASGLVIMDDIRIYNRALLPLEIARLYNSGEGCLP